MPRLKELVAAGAALSVAALALWIFGFIRHFQPNITTWGYFDLEMYFYPKFVYGAQEIAHGRIPLWNPYEFCGMPFLGTAQVAALYPVKNLIFALLPAPVALHANYLTHMVIAGLCAFAYSRWLGASAPASFVAAVMWAFARNFLGSVYHPMRIQTLAWVPLILLLFERALALRTIASAALAGAAVALDFTAGYPGYTLCTAVFLGLDFLFQLWLARREARKLAGMVVAAAGAGVFALTLAAPQILPLTELLGQTSRGELVERYVEHFENQEEVGISASRLPAATAVNLAFNAGPASPYSFAGVAYGGTPMRWFLVAAIFLVQAASGPALALFRQLPGFSLLRAPFLVWGMFPMAFCAPLAALGFDGLVGDDRRSTLVTVLFLVVLPVAMTLCAWLAFGAFWPAGLIAALIALGVIAVRRRPELRLAVAGVIAASFVCAIYLQLPYLKGARPYPSRRFDPALRQEILALANGGRIYSPSVVLRGEQMIDRLPVISGYEASLRPVRMGRLIEVAGLRENFIGRGPNWLKLAEHRRLLDLFAVSLVITSEYKGQVQGAGLLPGPTLSDRRTTFLNPSALQRAYVVHGVRAVPDPEAAYAAVIDPGFDPAVQAIIEAPAPAWSDQPPPHTGSRVRWIEDTPESVTLSATLAADGLLVLTDGYFPGWEATVDGGPAQILITNYAFRGVMLGPGEHRVSFRYRPRGFLVGVRLAGAAVLIALAGALVPLLRRGRHGPATKDDQTAEAAARTAHG